MPEHADASRGERTEFRELGFELLHIPGISRAWRRGFESGYVLITNPDGFDLPEPCGPFRTFRFAADDQLLEENSCETSPELGVWLRRLELRLHPTLAGLNSAQMFLPF